MRLSVALRCGALCALLILPTGVFAKKDQTTVSGAGNDPQTPTPADAATVSYLGATYALLPNCFGTLFVVGIDQTPAGQSDTILVAIPYAGGVATLPPIQKAATDKLANAALNDAICLDPPAS